MINAIAWALAEWSVRAALLAGVAGVLLWLCRVRDVHVRLTVWTGVLACAMLMPVATLWIEPIPLWIASDAQPQVTFLSSEISTAPLSSGGDSPSSPRPDARVSIPSILVAGWLVGAFVMLARLAIGLWLAKRLLARATEIEVGVRESPMVYAPVTLGLFKPVVLLPSDWRDWDPDKLRAVLAHERSHVTRRDPLRQFAASILRSVAWFHPLAWWIRAHLLELAELASDDAAIAITGDRITYAEALLGFIASTRTGNRIEGVAMATPKTRARRIERLLASEHKISRPIGVIGSTAVTAVLIPLLYLASATRPQELQAQALEAPRPSAPEAPRIERTPQPQLCSQSSPYKAWLEQDAVYIISPDERREYLSLSALNACKDFIEKFWLGRGTAAKEEHYRRISYANDRFRTTVPGWQTDRGR
ncbi:MAG TPA: M56 family metallopeptidase, partial [Bryobacteraceae bacterium]|nr:M56 family metallopeptidase [Bryobacteraceae bacterium]